MALLRSAPAMLPSRILALSTAPVPISVAPCAPVTSPASGPEKLTAVVALVALAAVVAVAALPNRLPVTSPVTLPARFAVIVPAVKLPEPSRITIRFETLVLVALLAALAPVAMLPAVWPPTKLTTVPPWVPVTSPASVPVKPAAVPEVLPVTLPVTLPIRLPVMLPPETTRPPAMLAPPLLMFKPAEPVIRVFEFKVMLLSIWPSLREPTVMLAALRPVRLPPLPLKALASTVPVVEMLMLPARSAPTMLPSRILAEFTALLPITVAPWVPITSPTSGPLKLMALVALVALVARATAPMTLPPVRLTSAAPSPLKLAAVMLLVVLMVMPLFRSAPVIVPSRILPEVTASFARSPVVMPRAETLKVVPASERPVPAL